MKKIIIISDTHSKKLPSKLKKDLEKCDIIIHAGDFTSLNFYDRLLHYNKNLYAVLGNMDKKNLEEFLPPKKTFEIEEKKFALMHGWGSPKNLHKKIEKKFENYKWDILIFGHTHSASAIEKDNKLILNPGSPTEKRFAKKNTYIKLILDTNKVNYELVEI